VDIDVHIASQVRESIMELWLAMLLFVTQLWDVFDTSQSWTVILVLANLVVAMRSLAGLGIASY
jgi:hypothetical protein